MLSSNVQSFNFPMDCTAWRFWTTKQSNDCSTPAPQWTVTTRSKEVHSIRECREWSAGAHLRLVATWMAAFAVNVALVARQWQHRAWTVPLHPSINTEQEAGQAASNAFEVFGMTQQVIEPASVASAQTTVSLSLFISMPVEHNAPSCCCEYRYGYALSEESCLVISQASKIHNCLIWYKLVGAPACTTAELSGMHPTRIKNWWKTSRVDEINISVCDWINLLREGH